MTIENQKLREEIDKLVQHHNTRQKLQYHVKIKQENNDLREDLRSLREEIGKITQSNLELREWLESVKRLAEMDQNNPLSTRILLLAKPQTI